MLILESAAINWDDGQQVDGTFHGQCDQTFVGSTNALHPCVRGERCDGSGKIQSFGFDIVILLIDWFLFVDSIVLPQKSMKLR